MRPELTRCLQFTLAVALAACGAGSAPAPGGPAAASAKGASADHGDGGAAGGGNLDAAAAPKPFAGSPVEATQLIGTAIDKQAGEMKKCVADYRTRKNLAHERVQISVGIDQEGRLLGATVKGGKPDAPFSECVQRALANAPFPRSHAGIIQVTKSYEEIEQ
jgi:hypothetical protein